MKAKNQPHFTSELDAKEKLIVYVYEYLIHTGSKQAAETFKESIGYNKEIKINDGPGFLVNWWCVFWDLYCAAPERRDLQPESSSEARALHDFNRPTLMSPSSLAPTHHAQPQQFIAHRAPRYGPPSHPVHGLRGPFPPRLYSGQPQLGPPMASYMSTPGPRYGHHQHHQHHQHQHHQHAIPQHQQTHMTYDGLQVPNQLGLAASPIHRNLSMGASQPQHQHQHQLQIQQQQQHQQQQHLIGGPLVQRQMSNGQMMAQVVGQAPSPVAPIQCANGPPRNESQGSAAGWQASHLGYSSMSSPGQQQPTYSTVPTTNQLMDQGAGTSDLSGCGEGGPMSMMMSGESNLIETKDSPIIGTGDPSTPHSSVDYVMMPFSQDSNDQCDSAEILKLKQSIQEDTGKMFEKDQFNLEYTDSQTKWS